MLQRFGVSKDMQTGIYSSIIASLIFLAIFEPTLSALGRFMLRITGGLFSAYQDRLYAEIATGELNFSYTILMFISAPFVMPLFFTIIFRLIRFFHKKQEHREVKGQEEQVEASAKTANPERRSTLRVFILVLLPLAFSFLLTDGYIRLHTITSFRQHITILTPYIEIKEKDMLQSRFASMRSRRDYDAIRADLARIAAAAKIELPDNKLYPIP